MHTTATIAFRILLLTTICGLLACVLSPYMQSILAEAWVFHSLAKYGKAMDLSIVVI